MSGFYISLKIGIDLWESKSVLNFFAWKNHLQMCAYNPTLEKWMKNSIDSSPLSWSAEILQTRYDAQYSKNGETSQKWIVFPCGFKILFNKNFENGDFIFWSFNTSQKIAPFLPNFNSASVIEGRQQWKSVIMVVIPSVWRMIAVDFCLFEPRYHLSLFWPI